jgi:hypothetical protein
VTPWFESFIGRFRDEFLNGRHFDTSSQPA